MFQSWVYKNENKNIFRRTLNGNFRKKNALAVVIK
jgi:hypothetical protein